MRVDQASLWNMMMMDVLGRSFTFKMMIIRSCALCSGAYPGPVDSPLSGGRKGGGFFFKIGRIGRIWVAIRVFRNYLL